MATAAVLGSFSTCQAAELSIAAGVDLGGDLKISTSSGDITLDSETGFSLGLKVMQPVTRSLQLGGGIDLHAPRSLDGSDDEVQYASGFFEASWRPGERSPFTLFARLGYSEWSLDPEVDEPDVDLDESGGLYLAAGIGYRLTSSLSVELLYQRLGGELQFTETSPSNESYSDDIEYSVASARLRYRF